MSSANAPSWAQELIERFDKLENTVNNCVLTRLDSIDGRLDGIDKTMTTMQQEISTLAESYDSLREMKGKVDELCERLL